METACQGNGGRNNEFLHISPPPLKMGHPKSDTQEKLTIESRPFHGTQLSHLPSIPVVSY